MEHEAWIEFDIPAICQLKEDYEKTIEFIKDELPDINWNSQTDVIYYFSHEHNIMLYSIKIAALKDVIENWNNDSDVLEYADDEEEAKQVLLGLIELKKLQYVLRNYVLSILKHNSGGIYPLRLIDKEWRMQNKQPLSFLKEINECIISKSENLK